MIRSFGILVFAVLIGVLVALPLTAPAAVRRPAPTQAALAAKFVRQIRGARTDAARTQAIYSLLRELEIGVVSRTGKPIVTPVTPGSSEQLYLYDFEVLAMARQFKRGELRGADDIASSLAASKIEVAPGKGFPTALLQTATRAAVLESMRKPREHRSLLPLVLRELGRTRAAGRQDLATVSLEEQRFDALQSFLINADVRLTLLAKIPAPRPVHRTTSSLRAGRDLANDCELYQQVLDDREKAEKEFYGNEMVRHTADTGAGKITGKVTEELQNHAAKWAASKVPAWAAKGASLAKSAIGPLVEGAHSGALAFSIKVTAPNVRQEVHYWHAGDTQLMRFVVTVSSLDDWGALAAKCGKLAGKALPRKGPVPGVTVAFFNGMGMLGNHGRSSCEGEICTVTTDRDGRAELTFRPKQEGPFARLGFEHDDAGYLTAVAGYQSSHGSDGVVGWAGQTLTPKSVALPWRVTYHEVPGVHVHATLHESTSSDDRVQSSDAQLEMDVCDPDPRIAPADRYKGVLNWTGTVTIPDDGSYPFGQLFAVGDIDTGPPTWISGQNPEMAYLEHDFAVDQTGVRRFWMVPLVNTMIRPTGMFEVQIWPGDLPTVNFVFEDYDGNSQPRLVTASDVQVTPSDACD